MFDSHSDVLNTTDDGCQQQVLTVALCLQQLTIPAACIDGRARLWSDAVAKSKPESPQGGRHGKDLNAATKPALQTSIHRPTS